MRRMLLAIAAIAMVLFALRFMVPIAANLFLGLGVAIPSIFGLLPVQVRIPLFFLGMPLLFVLGCWTIWKVAQHR